MKTKTLENSSSAALPGAVALARSKYSPYFGVNPTIVVMAASLPWSARNLPIIGKYVIHWTRIKEHLENGCLNPATIICEKEGLVAAFTSLTAMGEFSNPVIKIWKERVDLINAAERVRGAKFAAASTYYRSEESWARGCWSDFQPYVVDCLVDDQTACETAKGRLSPLAWEALDIGLRDLQKFEVGLHVVKVPRDIVWNAY